MIYYCRCSNNNPPVEERGPRIVCFFLSEAPSALSQPSSPFLPAPTTTFSSLRRHLPLFSLSRWLSLWSPTSTATSSFGGCHPSVVGRPPSIFLIDGSQEASAIKKKQEVTPTVYFSLRGGYSPSDDCDVSSVNGGCLPLHNESNDSVFLRGVGYCIFLSIGVMAEAASLPRVPPAPFFLTVSRTLLGGLFSSPLTKSQSAAKTSHRR